MICLEFCETSVDIGIVAYMQAKQAISSYIGWQKILLFVWPR